jgi:membrane associated rhomboid family serine protease
MVPASVGFHCPVCSNAGAAPVVRSGPAALAGADPIVTKVLIGLNAAAFLLMVGGSGRPGGALRGGGGTIVADFGLIGHAGSQIIGEFGVAAGEWWRLVTGGFLHGGLLHLGFNMLVLWLLGSQLERALGRARFITLYVTSLLAGSFGVMLLDPNRMTVGASGAIFGLMGAAVALQRAAGVDWWRSGLGTLLVVNLLLTFAVPNISVGGHIGGLVGGLAAGALMVLVDRRTASERLAVAAGAGLGLACVIGAIWAASQWRDPVLGFLSF